MSYKLETKKKVKWFVSPKIGEANRNSIKLYKIHKLYC